jgi:type II secretory pathway component GspD/PulD (secretin)
MFLFASIIVGDLYSQTTDYSDKNVSIELLVVEYEHGKQFDWAFDVTNGTTGRIENANYNPGSTAATIGFSYNFVGQLDPNFKLNLKALIENSYAQVVTNPHISVKNKVKATLNATETRNIILETASINGVSATLNRITAGINFIVTPKIVNDSIVELEVNGTISEFLPLSTAGEFSTEENIVKTTVRVGNGYSLIIGGLIKKEEVIIKSKVPLLGSIPLLGLLFRKEVKSNIETEMVIYITPQIHSATNIPKKKLKLIGDDLLEKNKKDYKKNMKTKKIKPKAK